MLEGQVAPFFSGLSAPFQFCWFRDFHLSCAHYDSIGGWKSSRGNSSHLGGCVPSWAWKQLRFIHSRMLSMPFFVFFSGILIMSYHSANYVVVATVLISWCYSCYSHLPLGCRCGQVEPRYWESTLSNNPLKIKRPKTSMIDFKQRLVTMNRYVPKSLRQKEVSQTMIVLWPWFINVLVVLFMWTKHVCWFFYDKYHVIWPFFITIFHQPEILLMTEIRRSPRGIYKTL